MSGSIVSFLAESNMVMCMVAICRVAKDGKLLEIKEVSDKYRNIPFDWDEELDDLSSLRIVELKSIVD